MGNTGIQNTLKLPVFLVDDFNLLKQIKEELNSPYIAIDKIQQLLKELHSFEASIMRVDHDYLEAWR